MSIHVSDKLLETVYKILPKGFEARQSGKELIKKLARRGHKIDERRLKEAVRRLVLQGVPCGGIPGLVEKGGGYYLAITEWGFERLESIPLSQAASGMIRVKALRKAWISYKTWHLPLENRETRNIDVKVSRSIESQTDDRSTYKEPSSSCTPALIETNSISRWNYDLILEVGKDYWLEGKSTAFIESDRKLPSGSIFRWVDRYGKPFGVKLRHRGKPRPEELFDHKMMARWNKAAFAWLKEKNKYLDR
jgi:hypothetical protein